MNSSKQIGINDTKRIDVIVDDIYVSRVPREYQLFIVADSTNYLFTSRATTDEYSVEELYDSISKGDRLTLIYYESNRFPFKKINLVVEARSENVVFRTLEEYNIGKKNLNVFVIVIFVIIEFFFAVIVFVYFWINYNKLKNIFQKKRKQTKHKETQGDG